MNSDTARRRCVSPSGTMRSRHSERIDRTNLPANAFKFGLREQDVVADESLEREDLNREEVHRDYGVTVRLDESRPGMAPFACGSRIESLFLKSPFDCIATDLVADIRERAFDSGVAPSWIFARHLQDHFNDLRVTARTAGAAFGAAVVLLCDKLAVPSEDGVRRCDRTDACQCFAAYFLTQDGQSAAR